ncbi:MAG TPA: hypothetical protein VGE59_01745 [Patescibacteria group bacterium]
MHREDQEFSPESEQEAQSFHPEQQIRVDAVEGTTEREFPLELSESIRGQLEERLNDYAEQQEELTGGRVAEWTAVGKIWLQNAFIETMTRLAAAEPNAVVRAFGSGDPLTILSESADDLVELVGPLIVSRVVEVYRDDITAFQMKRKEFLSEVTRVKERITAAIERRTTPLPPAAPTQEWATTGAS